MPKPSFQEYAGLIVEFLRLEKNRPISIKRNRNIHCHLCKYKHERFLIDDFDSTNKMFNIIHYNEDSKSGITKKQTSSELQTFLTQCFQRRHISLKELRKQIDVTEFEKISKIQVRVTNREKMLLEEESRNKKMNVSQYVRLKIFD